METKTNLRKMPNLERPLKPIIEWYNHMSELVEAHNIQLEAHILQVSLPQLRNIYNVNRFEDEQIELLDKHRIELNLAAAISQHRDNWEEMLTDEYLDKLVKSERRLSELYLTSHGEQMNPKEVMEVFIEEGYCGKVYQLRLKKFGKKGGFEAHLQRTLAAIARGKEPSIAQINTIIQALIQEHDSRDFDWTSGSLKKHCPKSVALIENRQFM